MRGNERLEMPLRVTQSGRLVGVEEVVEPMAVDTEAISLGGHVRFIPALIERVGWPQEAQKGLRAFQSSRARA